MPTTQSKKTLFVSMHCPRCGNDDIVSDAAARWDINRQEWSLSGTYDNTSCNACGAEFDNCDMRPAKRQRLLNGAQQSAVIERLLEIAYEDQDHWFKNGGVSDGMAAPGCMDTFNDYVNLAVSCGLRAEAARWRRLMKRVRKAAHKDF